MININPYLFTEAKEKLAALNKQAFVAAGDPSMGAPAPGGDPAAMGGAPPMDPSMAGGDPAAMAGGDPAAMGGAPPMDPMAMIAPMIQQAVQQAVAANGGGGGPQGAGPGIKPKIDVNVEIMQIKKMLAKIVDALGIHIPAADMVATPEDLNQIAEGGAGFAAATPDTGGGLGQISPIQPMKAAEWETGVAFDAPDSFESASTALKNNADRAHAMLLKRHLN
jgi:hypothetical protein